MASHPDWVIKHRQPATAIHKIKSYYYLYQVSSFWDAQAKKTKRKTGKCLGRITEAGFEPSGSKPKKSSSIKFDATKQLFAKEYGVSHFIQTHLQGYLQNLEKHFPAQWKPMVLLAYCRLIHQSAINQMPFHIQHSYLSVLWPDLTFTDKSLSALLGSIGRDRGSVAKFMNAGLSESEHLLIDMTNLPSKSGRIALAKSGYNSNWDFETQFNLLYIYSTKLQMPVFYRLVAGNIRDVSAMATTIKESKAAKCVIIGDKGFYSKANAEILEQEQLSYIMPLKRDNSLINYDLLKANAIKSDDNFFSHENRFIWFTSYQTQADKTIYLYFDDCLRGSEEKDYLSRIQSNCENYSIEGYHKKKNVFGIIAMITNMPKSDAHGVYVAYKTRMSIEGVFDVYKTILAADRTYMQQEDVLQGWLFINHIALQWYYQLYHLLIQHDMLKKYSVKNLIQHLVEIRMIRINDNWIRAELIKATQTLLKKLEIPVA